MPKYHCDTCDGSAFVDYFDDKPHTDKIECDSCGAEMKKTEDD
jgi:predicted nucleic acid-binding Zn ribbon protein